MWELIVLLTQCWALATFPGGGASYLAAAQHSATAGGAGDSSSDASAGARDASAVRTGGSGDGSHRTLEETTDGAVQAWGRNAYGEAGFPLLEMGDMVLNPETVTQLGSDTVRIECGAHMCFGKKTSGSWVSWGRGAQGQLALGSNADHDTPQNVPLLGTDTVRIACQAHACFGQKPSGAWVGWGYNTNGQLALGYNTDPGENAPVDVSLLSTDTVNIECTAEGCFGLKISGLWVSWGVDSVGQLALGGAGNRNTPQVATSLGSDVVHITCGPYHCLGRRASNDWLGWGWNNAGQLALGTDDPGQVWSAVAVPLLGTDTVRIVCGNMHCFGQKTSGIWVSWGHGHMGQLLTGPGVSTSSLERPSPQAVMGLGNDTAKVQCGTNFCLEQKADGQVVGWGANSYGELGAGFSSNYETGVQITSFTSGGLLYNYTTEDLYCGGYMCFGLQGPTLISDACYRDYSCFFCPAGEYDHDSNPSTGCLLCGAGNITDTFEEAGATSCTPCPSGYSDHDSDSKTACVPCGTGAFATPTACEDCPRGTADSDSSSSTPCEPCSPGFFADFGETSCHACEAGKADSDSDPATTCVNCAPGSFAPLGATSCSVCAAGYIDHDSDPATACAPADAGLCPAGTYAAEGSTECTNCTAGRADLDGTPMTACTSCPAGHEQTEIGQTECIPCAEGKADTDSNAESACDVCAAGMYAPEAATACYQCAAGEADVDNNPATSCESCPPGTYSPEVATECGVCSAGTYDHDSMSASQCVACTPGTFAAAGSTECIDCASGKSDLDFNPGTACTSCFEGHFSAAGSTECEACAPGRTDRDLNATTECEACDRGQYNSEEGRAGECDDCVAGKFASAAVSIGCENCDQGQYAGNGSYSCVACEPGKADMDEDPSTPCSVCPNGTHASCGSRECAQCDQGKHDNDLDAATPCVDCTPGQYWVAGDPDPDNPDPADSDLAISTVAACIDCPAGQVDSDRNSQTLCEPCALGQFSDAGSTRCAAIGGACTQVCPQGTEDHDCNPSTACETCAPGQYSAGYPHAQCLPCAPGSYAAPGSHPAACEACLAGQADNDNNQWTPCEPCRPGTFTADATNELVTSNATVCAECPPGRIDTDANASTSCSLCAVGKANPDSRSVNASACTPCKPGRWSYQRGMAACPDCQKGTYRGLEDLDGCVECDALLGTSCEPGSVYPRAAAGYFAELTTSESGDNTTSVMACVPFPHACLGTCTLSFRKSILDGSFSSTSDEEGLLLHLASCDSGLEAESCTDGYEGPRCSSCTKFHSSFDDSSCDEAAEPPVVNGYYRLESRCIPCPCTWITFYHIMTALFVAAVLFLFCLELVTTDFAEHASTIAAPVFIMVSFCQTIASFLDTRMPWPAFLRRLMVIFSSLNFNLELTRPECAGEFGALQKVQFALGMPLFVGSAMAVYALLTLIRIQCAGDATAEQRHSARNELRRKLASIFTTLFTVGAIFFTKSFLRAFDCVASELDSSRKFMASDPEILCSSPTHVEIERLSTIGLMSFAGCFVVICLFLIQNHLSDNPGLGAFAFLADKFEDHFFYWEMLIVLRKVLLMATFLLFQPVPAVLLATFLTIFSLSIHIAARPFEDVGTDWTEMLSLCAQLITLVSGPTYLILSDPNSGMSSDSAMTFLTVLELVGAIVLATALGLGLVVELYVCRAVMSNGNADEHDDFKIRTEQRALEDVRKVLAEKEALVAKLIEAHEVLRKEKEQVKAMHDHKQPASIQESNPVHEQE